MASSGALRFSDLPTGPQFSLTKIDAHSHQELDSSSQQRTALPLDDG